VPRQRRFIVAPPQPIIVRYRGFDSTQRTANPVRLKRPWLNSCGLDTKLFRFLSQGLSHCFHGEVAGVIKTLQRADLPAEVWRRLRAEKHHELRGCIDLPTDSCRRSS